MPDSAAAIDRLPTIPAVLLSLVFCLPSPTPAQDATRPAGTTVITHGYQLLPVVPPWPFAMAVEIRDRIGGGRVLAYDKASGQLNDCTRRTCDDPPRQDRPGDETFVVFDWADDSNELGSGFSEAAAEALFAALVKGSRTRPQRVNLDELHLIGHSRGSVVHSELTERLIAAGFPAPRHVTTLDPHDEGAFNVPRGMDPELFHAGLADTDVNVDHSEYRHNSIWFWEGVGFHDNYYREGCSLDPDGERVAGAANLDLSAVGGSFGNDICHLEVASWYRRTISKRRRASRGWFDPRASSCASHVRNKPLRRDADGFYFSRLGGGTAARCPTDPAQRQAVLFDFNLPEGLVNGDFERGGSGGAQISGWSFHGGGGDARTTERNDSTVLLLEGGQWRRHNRFYLPATRRRSRSAALSCRPRRRES